MGVLEGCPGGLVVHFVGIRVSLSVRPAKRESLGKNERRLIGKGNHNYVESFPYSRGNINPIDAMLVIHVCYNNVVYSRK